MNLIWFQKISRLWKKRFLNLIEAIYKFMFQLYYGMMYCTLTDLDILIIHYIEVMILFQNAYYIIGNKIRFFRSKNVSNVCMNCKNVLRYKTE